MPVPFAEITTRGQYNPLFISSRPILRLPTPAEALEVAMSGNRMQLLPPPTPDLLIRIFAICKSKLSTPFMQIDRPPESAVIPAPFKIPPDSR